MYRRNCDVVQEIPSEGLIVDILKDSDGTIRNIMSQEEVCKSMKKSNYFSFLDSHKQPFGEISLQARYIEGCPIDTPEIENTTEFN